MRFLAAANKVEVVYLFVAGRLQTADCSLQTTDCRLQIADCMQWTSDLRP